MRGDTLEVMPAYATYAYRIEFWGDEIERITEIDALTGEMLTEHQQIDIFPAKHFITPQDKLVEAIEDIEEELDEQVKLFEQQGKLLEAQRIQQRVNYDLEMLREVGYCSGVENYSRPLARREPGSRPWTLLDYFPDDYLIFIDESHMTIPQIPGHVPRRPGPQAGAGGSRLPPALGPGQSPPAVSKSSRKSLNQVMFVSATPCRLRAREYRSRSSSRSSAPPACSTRSSSSAPAKGRSMTWSRNSTSASNRANGRW